mmetsp:Transcript_61531/g.148192  ORF Transcript_61531/g.148192 Transcript_61531/m.148192 type:complete len:304 (+) Transcript_61531:373-1284(+)
MGRDHAQPAHQGRAVHARRLPHLPTVQRLGWHLAQGVHGLRRRLERPDVGGGYGPLTARLSGGLARAMVARCRHPQRAALRVCGLPTAAVPMVLRPDAAIQAMRALHMGVAPTPTAQALRTGLLLLGPLDVDHLQLALLHAPHARHDAAALHTARAGGHRAVVVRAAATYGDLRLGARPHAALAQVRRVVRPVRERPRHAQGQREPRRHARLRARVHVGRHRQDRRRAPPRALATRRAPLGRAVAHQALRARVRGRPLPLLQRRVAQLRATQPVPLLVLRGVHVDAGPHLPCLRHVARRLTQL